MRFIFQIALRKHHGIVEYVVKGTNDFCEALCLVAEDMNIRKGNAFLDDYRPADLYRKIGGEKYVRDFLAEQYRDASEFVDVVVYAASDGKILFGVERNDIDEYREIPGPNANANTIPRY